jgi:hypothetical protein
MTIQAITAPRLRCIGWLFANDPASRSRVAPARCQEKEHAPLGGHPRPIMHCNNTFGIVVRASLDGSAHHSTHSWRCFSEKVWRAETDGAVGIEAVVTYPG